MLKLCLEPPIYKVGELYYSPTSAVIDSQGERSRLRARESNLFHELIKTFPEVLSRSSIEETLWKDSYATNATINQTVKALRFSLEDTDRTLIRTIPKQGYVLAVAPKIDNNTVPKLNESNANELAVDVSITAQTISSTEVETVDTASEQSNSVTTNNTKTEATPRSIVNSITLLLAISIATFALCASGLFTDQPERISHQYGNHWILFNATEQELSSLPIQPGDSTKYVSKNKSFYRICSEIRGVLECQQVEL
ncbi:winged helix-turn-helix domain-containing protein [Vibrio sp. L5-1]|uniref:Winged helix-turn-helix domain-containing protein n=1 Tax=Vibrio echinoideorum TaxID=2100116 RepID=A0ABU9FQ23_9VIBR|nr:winged helix-turn-helix domain-containing protein [Vibrio sp. L5-1]MCF7494891.1 winged helix-turn-helix domain-containing protein [Vibrio sp. L5-1]